MVMEDYVGKIKWPISIEMGRGLEGAITNETEIGCVIGAEGRLIYRGYDIEDLAAHSNYEETTFLLIYGHLPSQSELDVFKRRLYRERPLPGGVIDVLRRLPWGSHPMSYLRTGISALGNYDRNGDEMIQSNAERIGIKLISQLKTLTAATARLHNWLDPIEPAKDIGYAANFVYMLTGDRPDEFTEKAMDVALILHADHGMNASTFTAMVVASTLSDMYSAIVSGIASLKGPLHGGANERSLDNLLQLDTEDEARKWVTECIESKHKIMGFGHRVYKTYDPRAKILKTYAEQACQRTGNENLFKIATVVEAEVIKAYGDKGIFPNVDFYSGILYYAMGIDPSMFTPIFAMSRMAGWVARVLEYLPQNRLFRPRAVYQGNLDLKYKPIETRDQPADL